MIIYSNPSEFKKYCTLTTKKRHARVYLESDVNLFRLHVVELNFKCSALKMYVLFCERWLLFGKCSKCAKLMRIANRPIFVAPLFETTESTFSFIFALFSDFISHFVRILYVASISTDRNCYCLVLQLLYRYTTGYCCCCVPVCYLFHVRYNWCSSLK